MGDAEWESGGVCEQCYTCGGGNLCLCLKTCLCPCLTYGTITEKLGDGFVGNCLLFCCCMHFSCLFHAGVRTRVREQYKLKESMCNDCCVTWCCPCCTLMQEEREMNARGSAGATHQQMS
eukprot:gb/GEZN01014313.1/.p1 GENE.gb/GEZN01014313.1/~~gb/GEZN01014313.1/.p1  ORF type:complete len:120 (+),score=0.99 gb/GEZN01014313.1/:28-387(+)